MLHVVVADGEAPSRGAGRLVNCWRTDEHQTFADAVEHHDGYRIEWQGIGVVMFAPKTAAVRLWPALGTSTSAAVAATLQVMQPLLLQVSGFQTLHASAVSSSSGVLAFCGASGAGKSTLAYALARLPGIAQIADDALVMEIHEDAIVGLSLPFRPRLRGDTRARIECAAARARGTAMGSPCSRATLAAIFAVRQSTDVPGHTIRRIRPAAAFSTLLTHAHCVDETNREAVASLIRDYLAVAARVPVYDLAYAPDFSRLGDLQGAVLSSVDASTTN
jgi:hypothetical protein